MNIDWINSVKMGEYLMRDAGRVNEIGDRRGESREYFIILIIRPWPYGNGSRSDRFPTFCTRKSTLNFVFSSSIYTHIRTTTSKIYVLQSYIRCLEHRAYSLKLCKRLPYNRIRSFALWIHRSTRNHMYPKYFFILINWSKKQWKKSQRELAINTRVPDGVIYHTKRKL